MKIGRIGGAIVALAIACMSHGALASTTWLVNCQGLGPGGDTTITVGVTTGNFGTEPGAISGSGAGAGQPDALGALLGTPDQGTETSVLEADFAGVTLQSGDLVEVTGICNQLVDVRQGGITITGRTGNIPVAGGPPGSAPIDGDSNQFIVDAAQRLILNNLLFGSSSGEDTLTTTGFFFAEDGMLTVVDGAQILLENSEVANSSTRGIFVRSSAISLLSSLVTDNGVGNSDQTDNSGIFATGGSAVFLGKSVAIGTSANADPSTVSSNAGDGIRVEQSSSLEIRAGTVSGNQQRQVFLLNSSSADVDGNDAFVVNGDASLATISAPSGDTQPAVSLDAGSSLLIDNQASVTGVTGASTITVSGSGTALVEGSFISGGTTTIEITGGSLLALAGGNYICNGTLTSGTTTPTCTLPTPYPNGDTAIEIDHVGALYDVGAISGFNFSAVPDNITGNGALQLQSTADLGNGLISGNPSLNWTTGAGGINVSQNSSLRIEGGVAITGSVSLAQGSNGFVNASKSGGVANTINGSIYCPFTNVAASHLSISGSTLTVTPIAPTLATSYASASPTGSAGPGGANTQGTCLTF